MADQPRKSGQLRYDLAGTSPAGEGEEGNCILVVDDDPDITRFVGAVLASRGISAISAYDPIQGFLVSQRRQPRLVLVDWHMPAGGGAQLLRKLRDNPKTATIPVVVVTGDAAPNLPAEAAQLGAKLFMHKPLDADRLVELVEKLTR